MEQFDSFCQFIHDPPNSVTPTAMKPGGVFSELYVLKKLLFCFVYSGFYLSVRIIELFRQLFVGSTIKQTAFQYGSVSFVEYP